jgi:hypothetical protein
MIIIKNGRGEIGKRGYGAAVHVVTQDTSRRQQQQTMQLERATDGYLYMSR